LGFVILRAAPKLKTEYYPNLQKYPNALDISKSNLLPAYIKKNSQEKNLPLRFL